MKIVIDNNLRIDATIEPLLYYRQAGRPKKRRHKSGGEVSSGKLTRAASAAKMCTTELLVRTTQREFRTQTFN